VFADHLMSSAVPGYCVPLCEHRLSFRWRIIRKLLSGQVDVAYHGVCSTFFPYLYNACLACLACLIL